MPSFLQSQPTSLLDQDEALETIRRRLTSDGVRLLTLTGPAGVGKTRLALESGLHLADAFPEGVVFVDLAPLREPGKVLSTIAQSLNIAVRDEVPLLETLVDHLRDRRLLLIIDAFDRLLHAAVQVGELLALSSALTVLVTSRVPLHLRWEQTLRVLPLAVPKLDDLPPLPVLARIPAVALFLARAQASDPGFVLTARNFRPVAELVVHLDGLPLAIEFAAARIPLLSPQMLVDRLKNRLSLLAWQAPDLPEHQRSLDSAIGWSYDLLSGNEQVLLQQLGVFEGGFDLDAAEQVLSEIAGHDVSALEGVASLFDKSLIQVPRQGEEQVRYFLLESVREYAIDQLEGSDGAERARRAHATYFLQLAEQADAGLHSNEQAHWSARLERERDNLVAALHWFLANGQQQEGLQLAGTLGYFWWTHGYLVEGWRCLDEALSQAPMADPAIRITALIRAGAILAYRGEHDRSKQELDEALTLARQREDSAAIAECLMTLGVQALLARQWSRSEQQLQAASSEWRALGEDADDGQFGLTLFFMGALSLAQAEHQAASSLLADAIAMYDRIGDERIAGRIRLYRALALLQSGDRAQAVRLLQEGIQVGTTLPDSWCLILSIDATFLLADSGVERTAQARLLGARDALHEPMGIVDGSWKIVADPLLTPVRALLEPERGGPAYRDGRQLPIRDIGRLMQSMLDESTQALPQTEGGEERSSKESILSERELEVLHLVAEGLSNKLIGKDLFISASTVSYHLTSIFNKLGVDTRAQAVAVAAQHHIL